MVARAILALALLLAPLGAWRAAPAAGLPICTADGGVRLVPDPEAPALPAATHCDACLLATPALPLPPLGLALPLGRALAALPPIAPAAAPAALPPEQARAPPSA